jgi:hypothetical protein
MKVNKPSAWRRRRRRRKKKKKHMRVRTCSSKNPTAV